MKIVWILRGGIFTIAKYVKITNTGKSGPKNTKAPNKQKIHKIEYKWTISVFLTQSLSSLTNYGMIITVTDVQNRKGSQLNSFIYFCLFRLAGSDFISET